MPPWRLDIDARAGVPSVVPKLEIARVAAAALRAAAPPAPASVAIVLSGDAELALLNEEHMGHAGATDVLSFPMIELRHGRPVPPGDRGFRLAPRQRLHLGDVILSVERAIEQAAEGRGGQTGDVRWSAADELRLLVVHGVLHVCGWDHAVPDEEAEMRALERRTLSMEKS